MAISLVKGQKVDLTKGNPDLNKLRIGLGWDANCNEFRRVKSCYQRKSRTI